MKASGQYTAVTQIGTKTTQVLNLARSAIAPEISATVMIAKVAPKPIPIRSSVPREP